MTLRIEKGSCKYTFLISLSAFEFSFQFTVITDFAFTMLDLLFLPLCSMCSKYSLHM